MPQGIQASALLLLVLGLLGKDFVFRFVVWEFVEPVFQILTFRWLLWVEWNGLKLGSIPFVNTEGTIIRKRTQQGFNCEISHPVFRGFQPRQHVFLNLQLFKMTHRLWVFCTAWRQAQKRQNAQSAGHPSQVLSRWGKFSTLRRCPWCATSPRHARF